MNTILWIIGLLLVAGAVTIYLVKTGKVSDSDGDLIPDAVEDTVEKGKKTVKEVKRRAKNVKAEINDVLDEVKDVKAAVEGKKPQRRSNKRRSKKQQ